MDVNDYILWGKVFIMELISVHSMDLKDKRDSTINLKTIYNKI